MLWNTAERLAIPGCGTFSPAPWVTSCKPASYGAVLPVSGATAGWAGARCRQPAALGAWLPQGRRHHASPPPRPASVRLPGSARRGSWWVWPGARGLALAVPVARLPVDCRRLLVAAGSLLQPLQLPAVCACSRVRQLGRRGQWPACRARAHGRGGLCGCTGRAAVSPGPGVLFSGLDDAGTSGRAAHDDAWPEQAASGTGKGGHR
jgi:hypothetical protein